MQIQRISNQISLKNNQGLKNKNQSGISFKGAKEQELFQILVEEGLKKTKNDFPAAVRLIFADLVSHFEKVAEVSFKKENYFHFTASCISGRTKVVNEDIVMHCNPTVPVVRYREFSREPGSMGSKYYKGSEGVIEYSAIEGRKPIKEKLIIFYENIGRTKHDLDMVFPKTSMMKGYEHTTFQIDPLAEQPVLINRVSTRERNKLGRKVF